MARYVLRLKDKGTFTTYATNRNTARNKILKQLKRKKFPKGSRMIKK